MGEVNIGDIRPGMVLASDLKDARGRFLLGCGTAVEEKHLRVMKIWGITAADVEGANPEEVARKAMEQIPPQILEKVTPYIEKLLSNSKTDHAALRELKRLCTIRTAEKLSKGMTVPGLEEATAFTLPKKFLVEGGGTSCCQDKLSAEDLVEKKVKLSSFPDIYYQIMEVLNDSRSSASRLADVVSKDPGLSATLLKLVNSAFYGLPNRVDSIPRAIALIGGREVSTLAMGISVIRHFKDIPPHLVDMKGFWLHSIACGVFARLIANRKVGMPEEVLFISGLLHDIGRLIMFIGMPKSCAHCIQTAHRENIPLYRVEQQVLGYHHGKVAGLLLKTWNFPHNLSLVIQAHHQPRGARHSVESAIVLVADIIAGALGYGSSGNPVIPAFEPAVWEIIDLSPSIIGPSITQANRQVNEIINAFHLEN